MKSADFDHGNRVPVIRLDPRDSKEPIEHGQPYKLLE